jgi:hypothetical protein
MVNHFIVNRLSKSCFGAPRPRMGRKRGTRWQPKTQMQNKSSSARGPTAPRMRDIETIDSELRLVAALRRAARERGGPLPSIDVADALLDERSRLFARLLAGDPR